MTKSRNQILTAIKDDIKNDLVLLEKELTKFSSDISTIDADDNRDSRRAAATVAGNLRRTGWEESDQATMDGEKLEHAMEKSLARIDHELRELAIQSFVSDLKRSVIYPRIVNKIADARAAYPLPPAEEKEWREKPFEQFGSMHGFFCGAPAPQESGNRHHLLFSEKKDSQPDKSTVAVKTEQRCLVM